MLVSHFLKFVYYVIIINKNKGRLIIVSNKEINVRSIIFLVIGILLVLSLVICIYIVSGERDLVSINATVVNVKEDRDGTGKNDVTVMYEVDGTTYEYDFYYKDSVKKDDMLSIYYHKDNVNSVQPYKTSKLIFVCPVVGLILCIYGLIELLTKSKIYTISDAEVKTKVVGEDERTQQLRIITDDVKTTDYVKTPEEEAEVPVKGLKVMDKQVNEDEVKRVEPEFEAVASTLTDDIDFIQDKNLSQKIEKASHDYLKDEGSKELPKIKSSNEVKKVIPKTFALNDDELTYQVLGQTEEKINLKDVKLITKTINSEGNLVKIVINDECVSCVLTSMRGIDLSSIMEELHANMLRYDPGFKEKVEYKEY